MRIFLENETATLKLGEMLARAVQGTNLCPVLFQGLLGSGKTTLVRGLVQALPGGENSEVSSPSFNLVNVYPTNPECVHIDLYRSETTGFDESLSEYLRQPGALVLVEWSELLPLENRPDQFLALHLEYTQKARQALITSYGPHATRIIENIASMWGFEAVGSH